MFLQADLPPYGNPHAAPGVPVRMDTAFCQITPSLDRLHRAAARQPRSALVRVIAGDVITVINRLYLTERRADVAELALKKARALRKAACLKRRTG
jgi:hypothetical protein